MAEHIFIGSTTLRLLLMRRAILNEHEKNARSKVNDDDDGDDDQQKWIQFETIFIVEEFELEFY